MTMKGLSKKEAARWGCSRLDDKNKKPFTPRSKKTTSKTTKIVRFANGVQLITPIHKKQV